VPTKQRVYLEIGGKRVFAGALDWPGWCRSGRDEQSALQALVDYGPRYKAAMKRAATGFTPPRDLSALNVAERLEGNATTDFGAPAIAPKGDDRSVDGREGRRLAGFLRASWKALDGSADVATGRALQKGPRGGGRELDQIVRHVLEAEIGYLPKIGGRYRMPKGADITDEMTSVRETVLESIAARARGEPMPPRRGSAWSVRYLVRRDAWHVLDHAWEIEDRAEPQA
jgi:hypothetical protein